MSKKNFHVKSKLFITVLSSCLFFIQAQSQCVADWGAKKPGCTAQFYDFSTGKPTQWLWDFGDGQTSTQNEPLHTYSASGTYTVCLTITVTSSIPSCTDTACKTIQVTCTPTGISSSDQPGLSLLVNNPVFSSADIHYSLPSAGNIELALFDIVSNKIAVLETGSRPAGTYASLLSAGNFSPGIYFISLDFEGNRITKKIILE